MSAEGSKVRVLVVDDSAIARDLIERGLSADPGIEVVGKAADAYAARDKIVFLSPDVITLDVEMPRMDGIEFLKRLLPQYPIPVVVVSAVTAEGSRRAMEALEAGAVDVVAKPRASDRSGLATMIAELRETVKEAARADMAKLRATVARTKAPRPAPRPALRPAPRSAEGASAPADRVVAIGASTGGTAALAAVLPELPPSMPPVVIVQHMPPVFTRMFAEALHRQSRISVKEAEDGDRLEPGLALVAPGDFHLRIVREGSGYRARLEQSPKVCGHRPSVDVLLQSVALAAKDRAVGLVMTGMGRDGAEGLLAMRRAGARCIAQDESSSVVFGMPKEAWENGAAESLVSLDRIPEELAALAGARG